MIIFFDVKTLLSFSNRMACYNTCGNQCFNLFLSTVIHSTDPVYKWLQWANITTSKQLTNLIDPLY